MNKVFLGIAALMLLVVSCSKEDKDSNSGNVNDNQIRLTAGVQGVSIKGGPINEDFREDLDIDLFAKKGSSWHPIFIEWDHAKVEGRGDHDVVFGGGPFWYPVDEWVSFYAVYPRGESCDYDPITHHPKVKVRIDGDEDLMWADARGRKLEGCEPEHGKLEFQHLLTQLIFKFECADHFPEGYKIHSLKIKDQPEKVEVNVEDADCTFSDLRDLEVIKQEHWGDGCEIRNHEYERPIMTRARMGHDAYKLDIVLKKGNETLEYNDVEVNVNAEKGESHCITIHFDAADCRLDAKVTDWRRGAAGEACIE